MKTFKKFFSRIWNKLCALLFGAFGFSSCIFFAAAYGSPSADYKVSGHVQNKKQEGIAGIKLKVLNSSRSKDIFSTDKKGNFDLYVNGPPLSARERLEIALVDEDGEQNGHYKNDTIKLGFHAGELAKTGGPWNEGTYEKKGLIITLEEVEKPENNAENPTE